MSNEAIKPIIRRTAITKLSIRSLDAVLMFSLVVFLTFFTILTPRDMLGLKKFFLGLTLLFNFGTIICGVKRNPAIFYFAIVLPTLMFFLTSLVSGLWVEAISYLYPFVYVLLVFPILKFDINIEKITLYVGKIMAIVIVLSCFLDLFSIMDIYSNPLLIWLNSNGEAKISKSAYAMFYYVIFFNASPILFFNLVHYIQKKSKLNIALIFMALLFTGTRINIILGTAILIYAILFYTNKATFKIVFLLAIIFTVLFFGNDILFRINQLFEVKSGGDSVRLGTITSIINALNSEKLYWLTGMGFGSTYYNVGRFAYVATSELSYLEFVREIGILFSVVVFSFLLYPLIKLYRKDKFSFLFYASYLFAGAFEPFIFTSTGFFVIMLMYTKLYRIREAKAGC